MKWDKHQLHQFKRDIQGVVVANTGYRVGPEMVMELIEYCEFLQDGLSEYEDDKEYVSRQDVNSMKEDMNRARNIVAEAKRRLAEVEQFLVP